jgi:TolB-like protein
MADIFVSYARQDTARVAPLVAALEAQGWSTWWDPQIAPGQEFDELITREIEAAGAVIVVWTPVSVASRWVRGEARLAADRGVLVPVRFGQANLPLDARAIQTTDLDDWHQDTADRAFQDLARALRAMLGGAPAAAPPTTERPEASAADTGRSIGVLPFVNMSGDAEQEYFSDGLSEELLNQLTQIKGLRVAARTSCFAFKGQTPDLKLVGERLGVAHVLKGSVRKAGKRLRITAQLIKAADGYHLWSNTFNRELDDVFAIQEDIARAVADALKVTLGMDGLLLAGGTRNVEAYDLFLRARAHASQMGPLSALNSIPLYEQAVALDPKFALAWIGLALAYSNKTLFHEDSAEESRRLGDEAIEHAKACAPDGAMVHAAQGAQLFLGRRDWIGAHAAYGKALELASLKDVVNLEGITGGGYGYFLSCVGRMAETNDVYRLTFRSDPLASNTIYLFTLDCAERYHEAEAEQQRIAGMSTDQTIPEYFALLRCMARDDVTRVKQQFRRYLSLLHEFLPIHEQVLGCFDDRSAVLDLVRGAFEDPAYQGPARMNGLGQLAAYFSEPELALACLRRAFVDKRGGQVVGLWHPLFASVRKTAGFKQLVRELGLYDYWRSTGHWGDYARARGPGDFECR